MRWPLALLVIVTCVHAQDPLHSPECDAARAVLDDAVAQGARERIEPARREAIGACLGRATPAPHRGGALERPIAVPAPVIQAPRVAAPALPAGALEISRPSVVTTCDASGCWDSDGRRLNQLGPMLVGPRGACTVQAGIVQCP